jgi:YD repeat-containing protein
VLFALASAAALAAPAAVLGPSGVVELGPTDLPGPERVQVDPFTGDLHIQVVDVELPLAGQDLHLGRVWRDGAWHWTADEHLDLDAASSVTWRFADGLITYPVDDPGRRPMLQDGSLGPWEPGTTFAGGALVRDEQGWLLRTDVAATRRFLPDGRWLEATDGHGNRTVGTLSDFGWLDRITGPGASVRLLHDGEGRLSATAAPGGQELFYEHREGLLVAVSSLLGQRTRYTYDDQGRLSGILWADGSRIRIARQDDGRVSRILGPGSSSLRWSWQDDGVVISDALGHQTRITTGPDWVQVTGPLGRRTRSTFDAQGRRLGWTDPSGAEVRLSRDDQGDLTTVQQAGGRRWRMEWDQGTLIGLTDSMGGRWRFTRDAAGAVTAITDPGAETHRYERDPAGELKSLPTSSVPLRLVRDARGRITSIVFSSGGRTRLRWDDRGRLVGLADPGGSEILISGWAGDVPTRFSDRSNAVWTLRRDTLGRVQQLEDPLGNRLTLERGSGGQLTAVRDQDRVLGRLRYRSDGTISAVLDALEQTWGLVHDAAGRTAAVLLPDGTQVELTWSNLDEVVAVSSATREIAIERDRAGQPTQAGPWSWAWDGRGALTHVLGPGLNLELVRDLAGGLSITRAQSADTGTIETRLQLDGQDRVLSAAQGDTVVRLQRGVAGTVEQLQSDSGTVHVDRDLRGLVVRMRRDGESWRALWDAEARLARWSAPSGKSISVDRTEVGQLALQRFPDGTIERRERGPSRTGTVIEAGKGDLALDRRVELDATGQPVRIEETRSDGFRRTSLHHDVLGQLVSQEDGTGQSWTWLPEQIQGPAQARVLQDTNGRPMLASPPLGTVGWGVAHAELHYTWSDEGCVAGLTGELGGWMLEHDGLGRLVRLSGSEGAWEITWDALGRPVRITDPDGTWQELIWGPTELLLVLEQDQRVELLHRPSLGWVWRVESGDDDSYTLVLPVDETGAPRVVLLDGAPVGVQDWTPLGLREGDQATHLAANGGWILFPGGPVLGQAGAWDPIGGTWTCPREGAELGWTPVDGRHAPAWDPAVWAPSGPWHDPIALLVELGEVDPLFDEDWVQLSQPGSALPWLPAAAGTPGMALLPPADSVPLDLDPTLQALLRASAWPASPVDQREIAHAILADDLPPQSALLPLPSLLPKGHGGGPVGSISSPTLAAESEWIR